MLSSLGQRARRYIRKGLRDGVAVEFRQFSEENSRTMYDLMSTAAGGNGVPGLRRFKYHRLLWKEFADAGLGEFAFAMENDTPVAGAFVIRHSYRGVYKDGGSKPSRGSSGAAYVLQWEIMRRLSAHGATEYDLWGSPHSTRMDDPTHPYHGVGVFKQAFTKQVLDRTGAWDLIVSPRRYFVWSKLLYPLMIRYYRWRKRGFY
jgi:lipid II:glycine glycyltransferase (peptidoglycan interpeptide bridge formation enzyme)